MQWLGKGDFALGKLAQVGKVGERLRLVQGPIGHKTLALNDRESALVGAIVQTEQAEFGTFVK